ncbi:HAD family hydrolase [Pasteurellaceae bacterium 20609_3]|uniref:HAD family hydrolase n=1 Tax=Spirabiliibacterium mucosae TaxID=28156 RepID=UPI001AAD9EF5|nr:HAD family hydrolase [Spirabiliibacterium mucosae]MBE2898736.1 HAD family hydrolase [Spirabiliibacterium mucosae]
MQPLVLFDLDETLIAGDSASLWVAHLHHCGWVDAAFVAKEQAMMAQYSQGQLPMAAYMRHFLSPLVGKTSPEIAPLVEQFVQSAVLPKVYAQAKQTLAYWQGQGARLIIVSATADFLVNAIAKALGITEVVAITCEQRNRTFTGNTVGVLSYQAGKVTRVQAHLQAHAYALRHARFYSDSINDLPLLQAVAHPMVINPDAKLHSHALHHHWPIFHWQ